MVDESLARTSNLLFQVAFFLYIAAMVGYFFRMAFTRFTADGVMAGTRAGARVGLVATALTVVGVGVHLASVVLRGLAAGGRVPWANMYEFSSLMALIAVVVGLVVVQRRMGMGHLMGFVLAVAVLSMTIALLLFTEAAPVVPALNSYWIKIHTSAAMAASAIFSLGFVATALYLVKDTAERRVADSAAYGNGTVGAARAPGLAASAGATSGSTATGSVDPDAIRPGPDLPEGDLPEHGLPEGDLPEGDRPEGRPDPGRPEGFENDGGLELRTASPLAQRKALSALMFPLVPFAVAFLFVLTIWRAPMDALVAASGVALLGAAVRFSVPYLPPAAKLDNLAYRVIAFGFPVWTFAIMAGAIWAAEAWGRYWGWDPKETGSFFTWTLYAAYLHARSTRGWRGRRAAWVAVAGFVALMVTYFAVNLAVVGLHSYSGV